MKKKLLLLVTLLTVLLAVLGGFTLMHWWNEHYLLYNKQLLEKDITSLDLSGKPAEKLDSLQKLPDLTLLDLRDTGLTPEEYRNVSSYLPNCKILWSVPFQNGYLDCEESEIHVSELFIEDLEMLEYLENLKTVNAEGCRNYDVLAMLKEKRPDLNIRYTVSVGGTEYNEATAELILENADPAEVEVALKHLPELTMVTFTGIVPENEQIYQWMKAYEQITFVWNFDVCGVQTSSIATELILSRIQMESVEPVESMLKYFYNLQKVEMCGCGISSEEMDALWKRNPETRFIWEVQVGVCTLRTDITVFMPYQYGYDGFSKLGDQHTAELKYCVDIICMDIGHMAISDYSFLAYMPHMQYLILADTPGKDFSVLAELKELVFLEIFMTSFDQAEVLVGLTKLEDLNIGTSPIKNIEPLTQMTWLKHLWLPATANTVGPRRTQLVEALPNTVVNFKGSGSTGNGWREIPNYYKMRDLLNMGYSKGW